MIDAPTEAAGRTHRASRSRPIASGVIATLACAATVGTAFTAASPAAAAGGPSSVAEQGRIQATPFALEGLAFGTKVSLAPVPADSSETSLVVLKCTRDAGIDRGRGLASDDLGGLGTVEGLATRTWTTSHDGVVTSHASSKVAHLAIGGAAGLGVRGLVVTTRTWHDRRGFHRANGFRLARLTVAGQTVPVDVDPGQQIDIPGILTATFDARSGRVTPRGSSAASTGLVVDLADGPRVTVARAQTAISGGVPGGLLSGRAQSLRGSGLLVTKNVVKRSPSCRGTDGAWKNGAAAAVRLPGLHVGAATVGALGDQLGRNRAVVRTRAKVARVSLGNGQVVVTGIRAQSNVVRHGNRWVRTAKGTRLARLTIGDDEQPLPAAGETVRIPGIARITPGVVARSPHGISVVGLRVTLLGGGRAGETIDISKTNGRIDSH